jgi:flagellar biosynthetic protein FlhB
MAEAEDRTESATQRRIEKARGDGQVAVSREVSMLLGLAGGVGAMAMQFDQNTLARWLATSLQQMQPGGEAALHRAALTLIFTVAPAGCTAVGLYALATVLQTEFLFHPEALQPDLSRVSPLAGVKRLFSMQTIVSLLKSLAKLSVFVVCLWIIFGHLLPALPITPFQPAKNLAHVVLAQGGRLAMMLLGAQAVIAAADLLWERMSLAKKLRMTRQEQRDEHKESEGNPHVKAKLRQLARAMAKRRMLKAVPTAAVVLTNPTHYAVALNYERGSNGAPRVVAKGADEVAEHIREIAREHRVPIIANPPLARALFRVEIDTEIPAEHFRAVAEIIAYVWRLRGRAGARRL